MNVTLPNGFVVNDVPDDMTQTELKRIAILNNLATPEDFGDDPFADERTIAGSAVEFAKAIPRAFAGSFLSAGEGLAELADAGANAIGLDELIDSGDDNELVRLAREGRESINSSALGADEAYQDQWSTKFGEGVGSLASFFTPAGAVKLVGLTGKAASTTQLAGGLTLAGGAGAGDQAQRIEAARAQGIKVSQEQEDASIGMGTLIGFSELAPVAGLLRKISGTASKQVKDNIMSRILSGLKSGGFEGLQEVTANIAQNAVERGVYNENLAVDDSMINALTSDEFTVGAASGFVADIVLTSIALRRNRYATQAEKDYEGELRVARDERIVSGEQAVSDFQTAEAQSAEQRAQEEQGLDFQPTQAVADPSQIDPPSPEQITRQLRRTGRYLEVTDATDPDNVETYQAEEKVRKRKIKGKNVETRYIIDFDANGKPQEKRISVNGAPNPNISVQEINPPSENFQPAIKPNPPKDYANHIYRVLGRSFPTAGSFQVDILPSAKKALELQNARRQQQSESDIRRLGEELESLKESELASGEQSLDSNQVIHTSPDGKKTSFGRNVKSLEEASVLAGRLNEKIIDSQVNNSVTQVINNSTESYSPEVKSTLVTYGDTILHPNESTFTASAIDSAAGTTISQGYQENSSAKDLVTEGVSTRKMTASQKLNAKRIAKGLPEATTFTPAEAKSVLGDNFSKLIRPPETLENAIYKATSRKNNKKKDEFVLESGNGDTITERPPTKTEALAQLDKVGGRRRNIKFATIQEARAYAKEINAKEKIFVHSDSVLESGSKDAKLSVVIDALQKNNIANEVGSPEIRALAENFTGVKATGNKRISDMNQGELKALVSGIRSLPRFDVPTKIPLFKHNRYTSDQFGAALEFVRQNNNDTTDLAGIAEVIGLDFRNDPQALKIAQVLAKDLKVHLEPVKNMPKIKPAEPIPQGQSVAVYQEPAFGAESNLNIDKLTAILKTRMKSFGLGDIGLNVSNSLRSASRNDKNELVFDVVVLKEKDETGELARNPDGTPLMRAVRDNQETNSPSRLKERRVLGYYSPSINSVFLGVDAVVGIKNMTPAQQESEFIKILDHEMIHGMRQLDLWTEKEWQLLSSLVSKKQSAKGGSFLQNAQKDYSNESSVVQMEEAIVEMTREARSDPKIITGRPRTLLKRISDFFTKSVSAINGFGFNSFDSVIQGIESGSIGSRERGPVRTLLETERLTGTPSFNAQVQASPAVAQRDEREAVPVQDGQRMGDFANVDSVIMESRTQDPYDFGYKYSDDRLPAFRGASELKEIRNTFLNDVTNAGFQSGDLIFETDLDLSNMSPQGRSLFKALEKDNFLGFERYDDAFLALFNEDISNYDPSQGLKSALGRYVNKEYETGFSTGKEQAKDFLSDGYTSRDSIAEIPEGAIESVVEENIKIAKSMPKNQVPEYSVQAEPRSQYVAQNPDKGVKLSPNDDKMYSRQNEPEYNPRAKAALDKLAKDSENAPASTAYLDVTSTGPIGLFLQKQKAKYINKWARLESIYQTGGFRDVLADSSALAAAMFADRSRGITSETLKSGYVSYKNGITKVEKFVHNGREYKGLVDVMSPLFTGGNKYGVDLERLAQGYAIAKRSQRLEAEGKAVPADTTSLADIQAEVDKYTDENGNSIVEEWFNTWQAYNAKTVEFLMDTGVLDAETAQDWINQSDYVPFYRQADNPDGKDKMPKIFSGMTSAATFKELKGGETAVTVPLLDAITRNLDAAVSMGMRNVAQQRIVRDMNSLGLAREVTAGQTGTNVINFRVDGKKRSFSIDDPLMYESMQSLDGGGMEKMLTSIVGAPSNILREMITRDPGFMIVNMMRDTLSSYVTSGASFIPVYDTVKNALSGVDALSAYGVVGGYDFSSDPDNLFEDFQKEMGRRGLGDGSGNMVTKPFIKLWDTLGRMTTASDAATRKAVFDDVLARTGNEAEAAYQALEVINFSRRGNSPVARVVTAAIPFLNARFQGLDVFYRSAAGQYNANKDMSKRKQQQVFTTRALTLAGLTGLYWLLVSDDEQYKEADEFTRDNNWLIPTPWGVPVKIPIPFEVGLIFKTIPEKALAVAFDKSTGREAAQSAFTGLTGTLAINPFGAQIVKPFIEAGFNYNMYTGNAIVSKYLDGNLQDAFIDRTSTNELARTVGEMLDVSPLKVEHVMRGYTGTIGTYILGAVDEVLRSPALTGDKELQMPSRPVTEFPIMKRFFANSKNAGAKEDFYELNAEIKKIVGTLSDLKRDGRMDVYKRYLEGREHLVGMKDNVSYIAEKLSKIRKQRDQIMRSNLSADDKRERIDLLQEAEKKFLRATSILKKKADLPVFDTLYR